MSLLIDALKRAERAKSGQPPEDAGPQAVTSAAEAGALTLAPVEPRNREGMGNAKPAKAEPTLGDVAAPFDHAQVKPEPKHLSVPERLAQRAEAMSASQQRAQAPIPATPTQGALVTPPSAAPAPAPQAKRTEGVRAPGPAIRADQEAAQKLFAAKQESAARKTRVSLLLVIGLATLLLAGGGFYVWYSFAFPPSAPLRMPPPSPVAKAGLPPTKTEARPVEPRVATPQTAVTQVLPAPSSTLEPFAKPAAAKPTQSRFSASKPAPARHAAQKSTPTRTPPAAQAIERETERLARVEEAPARAAKPRRAAVADKSDLKIERGESERAVVDPQLMSAYNALIAGDRVNAKRQYQSVLDGDPFNIDAHLGLASIAAAAGDTRVAERHYKRAAELDPQNATALAGLASISSRYQGAAESEIKSRLAREPESATLHFALGNQFAAQARWAEAQQAYFDALRLDSRNPDYAYDLAVSLDQLSQSKQAAQYYQQALALASNRAAHFNSAQVSARLKDLQVD
jgi:tetratricopeptide (TPR) repeat protein